ncbi:MAG: sugar phosphate isomerase/epimerase [Clostridia bacterium]|nr:sugar phosphate isomerase/epimerase [Clostridia bacterium]
MQIGAQMYTLRMFGQNERDLGRALEKVAQIGYQTVQLSALGPIEPRRIKALCDANGLSVVLTHNPEGDFLDRADALIEKHQLLNCRYIGLGYLPDRYHDPAFLPYFADDFGPAAEKIKASGMKMMYHNHAFEFARMPDGRTMMEHLLSMLPSDLMGVTADTYWLQYAGMDVCQWLKKHADRLPCVHLKDFAIHGFDIRMAAVGRGNIDFAAVLDTLKQNGVTEYALVEQDDCYGESPFDCLRQSYDYLQTIL